MIANVICKALKLSPQLETPKTCRNICTLLRSIFSATRSQFSFPLSRDLVGRKEVQAHRGNQTRKTGKSKSSAAGSESESVKILVGESARRGKLKFMNASSGVELKFMAELSPAPRKQRRATRVRHSHSKESFMARVSWSRTSFLRILLRATLTALSMDQ